MQMSGSISPFPSISDDSIAQITSVDAPSSPNAIASPTPLLGQDDGSASNWTQRHVMASVSSLLRKSVSKLVSRDDREFRRADSADMVKLEKGEMGPSSSRNLTSSVHDLIAASGMKKLPPGFGSYAMLAERRQKLNSKEVSLFLLMI